MNSFLLQFEEENVQKERKSAVSEVFEFLRERELLSLDFLSFGLSVCFGPRSKAVLRS